MVVACLVLVGIITKKPRLYISTDFTPTKNNHDGLRSSQSSIFLQNVISYILLYNYSVRSNLLSFRQYTSTGIRFPVQTDIFFPARCIALAVKLLAADDSLIPTTAATIWPPLQKMAFAILPSGTSCRSNNALKKVPLLFIRTSTSWLYDTTGLLPTMTHFISSQR